MTDLNFDILANTARAAAALERLARSVENISDKLDRIDGRTARADVDVRTAGAELKIEGVLAGLRKIARNRAVATVGIIVPAGIGTLTPMLASATTAAIELSGVLGVAAGGLAALGAVAATVKIGIGGIPEVFKQLGAADKASAATSAAAGQQREQIAKGIAKAQQGVADAHEAAARRVQGAEASLGQAQRQAKIAQEDLNQARKDAKEDLEDLKLSLSGAALSEEGAQIALERAQEALAKARAAGAKGLDLREAELGVKQASQSLAEARERYGDVKEASAEANRVGVEGSKKVVDAQRGVQDANRAVATSQMDLAQAQRDGVKQVAEAQAQLAEAMSQNAKAGSAASTTLAASMAKLAPSARDSVKAVQGLKPAWDALQVDVQEKLFAGLGDTITRIGGVQIPVLRTGMTTLATKLNGMAQSLGEFFARASTARDVGTIFANTSTSAGFLRNALTDVVSVFTDVATVGSSFLPELSNRLAGATTRVREFVTRARESGALAEWMQVAIQRCEQLGRIVGNVGGTVFAFFKASMVGGSDFLTTVEKITGELEKLVKSDPAQSGITAFFQTVSQTVDKLLPGVKSFATEIFNAVKAAADTGGLQKAGEALSGLLDAAGPLLPVLAKLAGDTLGSLSDAATDLTGPFKELVDTAKGMIDVLGPIGPAVVGAALAFGMLGKVGASITALGVTLGRFAGSVGVSSAAAARLTSTLGMVGKFLPIVGAAVVGVIILYEQMKDRSDELARSVMNGSKSLITAVNEQSVALEKQTQITHELGGEADIVGQGIGELTGQQTAAASATDLHRQAVDQMLAAYDAEIAKLPLAQQAQAKVTRETEAYALAVQDFGEKSPQAAEAAGRLQRANEDLKRSQKDAAEATKGHTERILEQWRASMEVVNTDLAYEGALLRVKDAQDRAAQAVKEHGVNSREAQQAFIDVKQANLDAAGAAGAKAKADAEAAGAANGDELAARAQKEELIKLAEKASGPVRQALLDAAGGINVTEAASRTAELQSRLHKDELGKLAGEATGPLKQALEDSAKNFDTLGGAHATAEERARLQKEELGRLAGMASGPVKSDLEHMAEQIKTLPDKTVTVTANGKMGELTGFGAIGGPELVRMAHGGALGGVISMGPWGLSGIGYGGGGTLPGFTPGRDVHTFISPTAGVLHLSGGEAIMRPEWTRAVGVDYVKKANAAAASGRSIDDIPSRSFAAGGLFLGGAQPFADMPLAASLGASFAMAAKMQPLVLERIKALQDFLSGGPGMDAALAWARTQQGKPYGWGMVGPASYDCSGFIAAIINVMRGSTPYHRLGTTASMPWPGFLPGLGPGLNVGNKPNDHMAGTIGNVNVESSGHGHGVQVGTPQAWGATNPYFTQRWHMPAPGGGLGGGGNFAGGEARAIVQKMATGYGWGTNGQWDALDWIIQKESGWDPAAANRTSSARGLFQKMTSLYGPIEPTVAGQAAWGLNYIARSHGGTPISNKAFHIAHGWYGNGGIITRPTFGLLGEDGPEMVLPLRKPGRSGQIMAQAGVGGDPGLTVNVTTSPYASAERIIASAMHQSRLNRMAGRYGGR